MSRDIYTETIAYVAADGTLKAAPNVQVTVYNVNSDGTEGSVATIFQARTGVAVQTNPFLTGVAGLVTFWANAGDYNIHLHDTSSTPKISDTTLGWSSSPGGVAQSSQWDVGDIKFSARNADYGRWLKLDGRQLTQTEVESALGLIAGDGSAIVAFLGTGAGSKYGSAASGKIFLPDTRRSMPMMAGPTSDGPAGLTARPLTAVGGVETVTLTSSQSGVPVHNHTASQAAHDHGASTGAEAAHTHGVGTLAVASHSHAAGTMVTTSGGDHRHDISAYQGAAGSGAINRLTTLGNGYSGDQFGQTTGPEGAHTHGVTGSTSNTQPGVSGNTGGGSSHSHSISSATPAVTVNNNAGANAASSHENIPPFVTIGFAFIRV